MAAYQKILEELSKAQIKYLIVGGFAVNFHQVQRATVDLDLIIHLEEANVLKFTSMMKNLGYIPKVPVMPEDFANPAIRKVWIEEKNMKVFSYTLPNNPFETIDVFVEEPMPFEEMWQRRFEVNAFNCTLFVVGLEDLITMKKAAGRDKDEFDIKQLEKLK